MSYQLDINTLINRDIERIQAITVSFINRYELTHNVCRFDLINTAYLH